MGEEEAIDWNRGRNVGRINKQEKKKKGSGDVNYQRNEDLLDMKYVVMFLCSRNVTVANPRGD